MGQMVTFWNTFTSSHIEYFKHIWIQFNTLYLNVFKYIKCFLKMLECVFVTVVFGLYKLFHDDEQ